jgi:hypothetical protein
MVASPCIPRRRAVLEPPLQRIDLLRSRFHRVNAADGAARPHDFALETHADFVRHAFGRRVAGIDQRDQPGESEFPERVLHQRLRDFTRISLPPLRLRNDVHDFDLVGSFDVLVQQSAVPDHPQRIAFEQWPEVVCIAVGRCERGFEIRLQIFAVARAAHEVRDLGIGPQIEQCRDLGRRMKSPQHQSFCMKNLRAGHRRIPSFQAAQSTSCRWYIRAPPTFFGLAQ